MANSNASTPLAIVDSIEGGTSDGRTFDELWENMLAAVPSPSPAPFRPDENTEQVVLNSPRITLGSPWTPTSYSLPQRERGSTHEFQHPAGSRGSTPAPSTPSREDASHQAVAHTYTRQETTPWQSRFASTDPKMWENGNGSAQYASTWSAEMDSGEESDLSRNNQIAFERRSSQTSSNAMARHDEQQTASSSQHRRTRDVSRRSSRPNPKTSVGKRNRMADYSRFLLSRIQQVATEVNHNQARYQTSGDGEEEITVLTSIDEQLNDLLRRRVMRRGESVLSSSHWSDTGSMRDVRNDRSEGSNNDWI